MATLMQKLAKGIIVTDRDIRDELYEICDREHAHCNYNCPVYEANGNQVPMNADQSNCSTFKDGKAMLDFLRTH